MTAVTRSVLMAASRRHGVLPKRCGCGRNCGNPFPLDSVADRHYNVASVQRGTWKGSEFMSQLFMRRPNLDDLPDIPLPPGATLREYQEGDQGSLAALMRAAFDDAKWTPERVQTVLIEPPDVAKTFVIEQDGEIVATASARLLPE